MNSMRDIVKSCEISAVEISVFTSEKVLHSPTPANQTKHPRIDLHGLRSCCFLKTLYQCEDYFVYLQKMTHRVFCMIKKQGIVSCLQVQQIITNVSIYT